MLSIVAIVLSVIACIFVIVSHVAAAGNRRRERIRFRRAIIVSRRRTRRVLVEALNHHAEGIESIIAKTVSDTAKGQIPQILAQLRQDQRATNVVLARWIRREESRFRILLNARVEPIEASAEHAVTLAARVVDWLKGLKPWGRKTLPEAGSPPRPGTTPA